METCDVVVIGGGLSGLSAAAALAGVYPSAKASSPSAVSKVGVVVLEANRRLGGRSFTVNAPVTGVPVDLGGQWIGAKHNVLREVRPPSTSPFPPIQFYLCLQLATALGVKIVPQHYQGKRILELNGSTGTYSTDIPTSLGLLNLIDLQQAMFRVRPPFVRLSSFLNSCLRVTLRPRASICVTGNNNVLAETRASSTSQTLQ